jgi:hypothetical protein
MMQNKKNYQSERFSTVKNAILSKNMLLPPQNPNNRFA